jgi:hypothetical protein
MVSAGTYVETLGYVGSGLGTAFTPGINSTWGSYVSLGTTTKDLWNWQIAYYVDNATRNVRWVAYELSYGADKIPITERYSLGATSEGDGGMIWPGTWGQEMAYFIPAGTEIFIRGWSDATGLDTGNTAMVVAIGG